MKLSNLLYFSAGVAECAVGRAAYPKIKESLGPVASAAHAGAEEAIADAFEAARNAAEQAANAHATAAEPSKNGAAASHA